MDLACEEEGLPRPVVPAAAGGEHIVVLPEVYVGVEGGALDVRTVVQRRSLDEHGVREHVHIVGEGEQMRLRVVGAVEALDDLAVLVFHRRAVSEHGDAVLGVVVQIACAESVFVFIHELHHASAELSKVLVHVVIQRAAGQHCALLHQFHVAFGVDYIVCDSPECCVADQISVVVEKSGVDRLAEGFVVFVGDDLHGLGLDQAHHVALLRRLWPRRSAEQGRQKTGREQQGAYFLIFSRHPAREKSQSLNIGSMTMCVSEIFLSMKLLIASICFAFSTML